MNPAPFPPRGSSLSPRALRRQISTPPAALNSFASPLDPHNPTPIRRKPLPPTAFTSPLSESPVDAGVLQSVSGERAKTHPAGKEDENAEVVVRNLDRCVPGRRVQSRLVRNTIRC